MVLDLSVEEKEGGEKACDADFGSGWIERQL